MTPRTAPACLALMLLAPLCAAVTCDRKPPVEPVPTDAGPEPLQDASVDSGYDSGADANADTDASVPFTACERACAKMQELKCPGWQGAEEGPCVDVCENHERSGFASFCPEDVARMRGQPSPSGQICDEEELEAAFEACL